MTISVGGRELHDLTGVSNGRAVSDPRHHQMAEPGRQPMPGIVLHRLHLGGRPERVRHTLGGALVMVAKPHADMAIVEDGVVSAIGLLDLVQRLRD